MPTINVQPVIMSDGTAITQYSNTVKGTETFTFLKDQEAVTLANRGSREIQYTLGGQTGTLLPSEKTKVTGTISSFTLTASQGTQHFEIHADEVGTSGISNAAIASLDTKVNEVSSQLAQRPQQMDVIANDGGLKFISHRGANRLAPENTIPAFRLAGQFGYWGVETDVCETLDNELVIMHDNTMDAMTDMTGEISSLTLAEVRSATIDSGFNLTAYPSEKVPTFEEYLQVCKEYRVIPVIEIKNVYSATGYDKFVSLLEKYGFTSNSLVMSFDVADMTEIRNRNKKIALGLVVDETITTVIINNVKSFEGSFITIRYTKIVESDVLLCHQNGLKIGVWTLNDITTTNTQKKWGLDFITTDTTQPPSPRTKKLVQKFLRYSIRKDTDGVWKFVNDVNTKSDIGTITKYDGTTLLLTFDTTFYQRPLVMCSGEYYSNSGKYRPTQSYVQHNSIRLALIQSDGTKAVIDNIETNTYFNVLVFGEVEIKAEPIQITTYN